MSEQEKREDAQHESEDDRFADEEPIAHVFDDHPDTEDELIANVYTLEAAQELEDAWWTRVEWVGEEKELITDGGRDTAEAEISQTFRCECGGDDELTQGEAERRASNRERYVAVPMPYSPDHEVPIGHVVDSYDRQVVENV